MRYADEESVLHQLNELDVSESGDSLDIALVTSIENSICNRLDDAMGRTFGVPATPTTRILVGSRNRSPRLILSTGVRSVSAVEYGGEWNGTIWSEATVVPVADYSLQLIDRKGIAWAIDLVGGSWPCEVRVTGIWDDLSIEAIPVDLKDAAGWLTVEEFRLRKTSPAGSEGPDGMLVQPRNPWNFETVKRTINRLKVGRVVS